MFRQIRAMKEILCLGICWLPQRLGCQFLLYLPHRTPIWLKFRETMCQGGWTRRMIRETTSWILTSHEILKVPYASDGLRGRHSKLGIRKVTAICCRFWENTVRKIHQKIHSFCFKGCHVSLDQISK